MTDKIVWSGDMSVGCKTLDDDHKVLIQALNDFIDAIDNDEGVFVTDGIFAELVEYTNYHFKREEKVIEICGYADIVNHKKTHESLKEQLMDSRTRYMLNPNAELEDEVRNFLTNWLQDHILINEMTYSMDIKKCGKDVDEQLRDVV
ncbi:MAG: hemerythrin family protein [Sphingomonadales bacterium]|nr:hemerythrin family protein [Sphingomonadales bacterium]